jgi:two-component system response regulator HydG
MAEAREFRADLYYRLAGVDIQVPPLRARRDDIPLLIQHFLQRYGRPASLTIEESAREALSSYGWPGNVRQLARVLERALALADGPAITLADLPDQIRSDYRELVRHESVADDTLRAWSSRYVRLVLDRCRGNKRRACDILDISYHTLRSHLAHESNRSSRSACDAPL